jgi:Transposase
MSTMPDTKRKRTRRSFSDEFKAGAVRLVLEEGKTVGAAAHDLDLTESPALGVYGLCRSPVADLRGLASANVPSVL